MNVMTTELLKNQLMTTEESTDKPGKYIIRFN